MYNRKFMFTQAAIDAITPGEKPLEYLDTECPGLLIRVQPTGYKCYYLKLRTPAPELKGYRIKIGDAKIYKIPTHAPRGAAIKLSPRHISAQLQARALVEDIRPEKQVSLPNPKLGDFLDNEFLPFYIEKGNTRPHRTISEIRRSFPTLMTKRMDAITHLDLIRWRKGHSHLAAGTLVRREAVLSSALSHAKGRGYVEKHPLESDQRKRPETHLPKIKLPTTDQYRALTLGEEQQLRKALIERDLELKAARARSIHHYMTRDMAPPPPINGPYADYWSALVLTALGTGIRLGALLALKWEDIQKVNGREFIVLNPATDKSGYGYKVPYTGEVKTVLESWRQQTGGQGHVFTWKGHPVTTVKTGWKGLLKRAGLTGIRFHDLRHTRATRLVAISKDPKLVMRLMGHRRIETTLRYFSTSDADMFDLADKVG